MKLGKIHKAHGAFSRHKNELMNAAVAFKIFKFCKEIEETHVKFYNERADAILLKYGHPIGEGRYKITEDKKDSFNKEMDELFNTEVEAPRARFTIEELQELKLSPADIEALEEFIQEA